MRPAPFLPSLLLLMAVVGAILAVPLPLPRPLNRVEFDKPARPPNQPEGRVDLGGDFGSYEGFQFKENAGQEGQQFVDYDSNQGVDDSYYGVEDANSNAEYNPVSGVANSEQGYYNSGGYDDSNYNSNDTSAYDDEQSYNQAGDTGGYDDSSYNSNDTSAYDDEQSYNQAGDNRLIDFNYDSATEDGGAYDNGNYGQNSKSAFEAYSNQGWTHVSNPETVQDSAKDSEDSAKDSEDSAKGSEDSTKGSEDSAKDSEDSKKDNKDSKKDNKDSKKDNKAFKKSRKKLTGNYGKQKPAVVHKRKVKGGKWTRKY